MGLVGQQEITDTQGSTNIFKINVPAAGTISVPASGTTRITGVRILNPDSALNVEVRWTGETEYMTVRARCLEYFSLRAPQGTTLNQLELRSPSAAVVNNVEVVLWREAD